MKRKSKGDNPVFRFFRMLVEARWFFTFSSGLCSTIIGISLTFGINSCRESRRLQRDVQKSMLQATENLGERIDEAKRWLSVIIEENKTYEVADSFLTVEGKIPQDISIDFYNSLPYVRLSSFDHEFEKIFRGSYELWQVHNNNDSLNYYISQCFDGLNIVETTCEDLTESMLELIGVINAEKNFYRSSAQEWTYTLVSNPKFQYYMSVRNVKSEIASAILEQVGEDYRTHVIPLSEPLRHK